MPGYKQAGDGKDPIQYPPKVEVGDAVIEGQGIVNPEAIDSGRALFKRILAKIMSDHLGAQERAAPKLEAQVGEAIVEPQDQQGGYAMSPGAVMRSRGLQPAPSMGLPLNASNGYSPY